MAKWRWRWRVTEAPEAIGGRRPSRMVAVWRGGRRVGRRPRAPNDSRARPPVPPLKLEGEFLRVSCYEGKAEDTKAHFLMTKQRAPGSASG